MELYKNKYRISSARLQGFDYGANGAYFITICTQNREHFFGEIVDDATATVETPCMASLPENKMQLNELGRLVETEWVKTIELRPDMNLEMGAFVVMPNHFHAIIIIGENEFNSCRDAMQGQGGDAMQGQGGDAMHRVSTALGNVFGPQSKNLASIVRGFKSAITAGAKKMGITDFAWQSRFHDHIIRNSESFERIQNYIADNPFNWKNDTFNQ